MEIRPAAPDPQQYHMWCIDGHAALAFSIYTRQGEARMISTMPLAKKKIWKFPDDTQPPDDMVAAAGGHEILARLMMRRGIDTPEKVSAFLDPSNYTPSSPSEFAEMGKATARIARAIASKEKITVYGDYDVDGVTGTSLLLSVLKDLGANVDFYIPNRATEGYGLNLKAVSILASKHRCKLLITCDCGISNFAEINLARSLGVDTIIVDHHTMPEVLPPAVATLHPKQLPDEHPLFNLPGVGVAYKLAEALLEERGLSAKASELHDFVTLGMIADMVPLVQENRYLVQVGLPRLAGSTRPGIRALLDNTAKMDGTDVVGFGLAPRINAVGRLADASIAVRLMVVEDESEAQEIAQQLEMENTRRQELCENIFCAADIKARHALSEGADSALALFAPDWHHGVVGIVASRLVEKYHCPAFVAELDEEEGILKGSARGVNGIDLCQILKENDHLMTKWGGHQMAAGFSAPAVNADALCRALVASCNRALSKLNRRPILEIDLFCRSDLPDLNMAKLLRILGPFGMSNKKPVLAMKDLEVLSSRQLGKDGKHHRLMLRSQEQGSQFECVYWRSGGNIPADGASIDLAFTCEVNVFNNTERLQLVLCDWRNAGEAEAEQSGEILDFNPAAAGETAVQPARITAESTGSAGQAESVVMHLETRYDGQTASTRVAQISAEKKQATPVETINRTDSACIISFKDLRSRDSIPVVEAARRNLSDSLNIFAEACKLNGVEFCDRSSIEPKAHLLIWQYPPALPVFRSIIQASQPSQIYLCGGAEREELDASTFLKRLMAMIRYAVNQRDGQAHAEKLCAGLSTTKMALALGLTLLRKLDLIDWYSEDQTIFLETTGNTARPFEEAQEYRHLANTLKEITDFRNWCAEAPLNEIQSELVPNSIRLCTEKAKASQEGVQEDTTLRANYNDRTSHVQPGQHGKG